MPINNIMYPSQHNDPGMVCIAGSFQGAGTSAPVNQLGKGVVVTRSAAGTYLLTLPGVGTHTYYSILLTVENSGGDLTAFVEARSESARTVTVSVQDLDGTPTDTDLVTGDYLHYQIWLKNSTAA